MKTTIVCLVMALVLCGFDLVQERTITGTVTDAGDSSAIAGVNVILKGTKTGTVTDGHGRYTIRVPSNGGTLIFSFIGYATREVRVGQLSIVNVQLTQDVSVLSEQVITGAGKPSRIERKSDAVEAERKLSGRAPGIVAYDRAYTPPEVNTEEYEGLEENIFHGADKKPLSTFSIDVDAASYSNLRRFINNGQRPPKDAVRIEEMINYFDYDYAEPKNGDPFNVYTEIAQAPWNPKHQLVHIGLQGKRIPVENLPSSNLVFLIDVSGSMNQPNKLPLVKKSFAILTEQLRAQDHVSIVVYAGMAGVVLEPTPGTEKRKIVAALDKLQAGGSTAGGAGLRLAYDLAREHFEDNGNNRVIIATDGDFNVGESSNKAMEDLIEAKRKEGVYLTVLGYGMGNLKDSKMEILADKGNGNYAYIDNFNEARKVLVNEFAGTLFTIATDVKLQVEFNPARVQAYRLVGYENRMLKDEDFNNDRKDAGDLGSGHTVTALYEIIPVGVKSDFYSVDDLKYRAPGSASASSSSRDWLTVKLRYKRPGEMKSRMLEKVVSGEPAASSEASDDFRWSASVAAFGMLLTESQYLNQFDQDKIIELAGGARGKDAEGYRSEFVNLVKSYALFSGAESRR
ncbi:MAG: von Willebrand factor type A domain-containing protein [Bacteroidota bacterium]|nr:von Willebrand factor type A domain-containing protein [Bacteroidota bacterium]